MQTYATKAGDRLHQGNGTNGGWNYDDNGFATSPSGPWNVGSGSEELNGTYDMMGNVWEWVESPYSDPAFGAGSSRGLWGGYWFASSGFLQFPCRVDLNPALEDYVVGFRVASVPEPSSITMLLCGAAAGLLWWKRRK